MGGNIGGRFREGFKTAHLVNHCGGNVALVPDSLFLDAFARYDQQAVNIGGRTASSNLFQTDNRTDYFVYGASPYHVGRWSDWGESLVRYQYQAVR